MKRSPYLYRNANGAPVSRCPADFDGDQIGQMDTLIGAIACYHAEPIITRNKQHFGRIPGLAVRED